MANVQELIAKDISKLSQEERDILAQHLTGGRAVKAKALTERVIREDIKIRCDKFAVEDNDGNEIEGAYRDFFYLVSESELTPGSKHWIKTRRAWPSHVMVLTLIGKRDGKFLYAYDRLKSDGTRRVE